MKTDQQLKSDVVAELAWDQAVDPTHVGVAVLDGTVALSGQVDTYLQKHAVERAVRRVPGVRGIAMDVDVRLAPGHQRSDAEVARAAVHALAWHSQIPQDKVKVQVDDGWVTLTGEVDWGYQLASAEQCIHPLVGVRGISNQIRLKNRADPAELREDIAAAFARHARREAGRLAIEVDGSVVTLRGNVDSLAERDAAIGIATAARGVTQVIDHVQVGG